MTDSDQNQQTSPEELLTARDAAAQLHVSTPHAYAMARNGIIKCVRIPAIGNTDRTIVRFRQRDIDAFIAKFNK